MTMEEAESIVLRLYPGAFPFSSVSDYGDCWSICNGTRTEYRHIRIPGVGFHATIEAAWMKAAEVIKERMTRRDEPS